MIDYDVSRYPIGATGWADLLDALAASNPADESEWVEFKADLDLRRRAERPSLAKAIVAFANRDPERALRWLDGRALIVVGLEPGRTPGAAVLDSADLHNAIAPYLAEPAPGWDFTYLHRDGKDVLVITVDAPRVGDPIHVIAKAGDGVSDGNIYVRRAGLSQPATSADVRRLTERSRPRSISAMAVAVEPDGVEPVPSCMYPDAWIDTWESAERARLLAPLDEQRASGVKISAQLAGDLKATQAALAGIGLGPFATRTREETRSPDDYRQQVQAYLEASRSGLEDVLDDLRHLSGVPFQLALINQTDSNYTDVEVSVHLEGDVWAYRGHVDDYGGLRDYLPNPPRIWGPSTYSPGFNAMMASSIVPAPVLPRLPGPLRPAARIENGGSTRITFVPVHLRPRGRVILDDRVVVVGGPEVGSEIRGTWTATATNMDGAVSGSMVIAVGPAIDLGPLLTQH